MPKDKVTSINLAALSMLWKIIPSFVYSYKKEKKKKKPETKRL